MPAKSEAQRRYLNMKFGHEWVKEHHFDNKGKLPAHAGSSAKKKSRKKRPGPRRTTKGNTTTVTYGEY